MLVVRGARDGATRIVALCGELDMSNCKEAQRGIFEAMDEDCEEVVIDLRELQFLDSTGIALLVSALNRDGDRGRLRFVPSPFPNVTRVLEITGLLERLPVVKGPAADYFAEPKPSTDDDPVPAS